MDLKFSIGARIVSNQHVTEVPGPGTYNLLGKSFESIKSMKFGTGQRQSLGSDGKMRPGPGEHSPEYTKIKVSAPKFGFGSETRNSMDKLRHVSPGPGNY